MQKFDDLFGVVFGERTLKHKDNLSKHYSKSIFLLVKPRVLRNYVTVRTLKSFNRNEESFDLLWEFVQVTASKQDV